MQALGDSIGVATSQDGLSWERYENNPILAGDDIPFSEFDVNAGSVLVEDGQWVMYFFGRCPRFFPAG